MTGSMPVIRLELERMRSTILTAFQETVLKQDEQIRAAVEAYCQPDSLTAVISAEVNRVLDEAIKEEVRNFYRYGEGRQVIKEAVARKLASNTTATVLDIQ